MVFLTLCILCLIILNQVANATLILNDGLELRTFPVGGFGKDLSHFSTTDKTTLVKARLQYMSEEEITPCVCGNVGDDKPIMNLNISPAVPITRHNKTATVDDPDVDLPIALLLKWKRNSCGYTIGDLATTVESSLKQSMNIQYLIIYAGDEEISDLTLFRTMVSDVETSLGLLLISHESGEALLHELNAEEKVLIGIDGSFAQDYAKGRKILALLPKFTALLSLLGSSYIIYSVVFGTSKTNGRSRSKRNVTQLTFSRLLILLSIADISSSFGYFLSTWMIPKDSDSGAFQYAWNIEFPYASGNAVTCSFQGFLIHFGFMGSVLMTAFIAMQFVFQVRYRWTESKMRIAEKVFFVCGVIFPLLLSISFAAVGAMNPTSNCVCHIMTSPYNCEYSQDPYCMDQKANPEWIFHLSLYGGMIWVFLSFLASIVSMVLLYLTVRAQERRVKRWSITGAASEGRRQKQVINKAFMYIGAFLFVWTPTLLKQFVLPATNAVDILAICVLTLQGFFNAIIYTNGKDNFFKWLKRKSNGGRESSSRSSSLMRIPSLPRIIGSKISISSSDIELSEGAPVNDTATFEQRKKCEGLCSSSSEEDDTDHRLCTDDETLQDQMSSSEIIWVGSAMKMSSESLLSEESETSSCNEEDAAVECPNVTASATPPEYQPKDES